jgi:hypothetical protein
VVIRAVSDFKTSHRKRPSLTSLPRTSSNGRLVTYDTIPNAIRKANYITQQGLGGAMYWELSGDKQIPGESLIKAMARTLGGGLQYRENELNYPGSSESA